MLQTSLASRFQHSKQGVFEAKASPFTVAAPMRTPVNEPGPAERAKRSISHTLSDSALRADSIIGKSVSLCVFFALSVYCANGVAPFVMATDAMLADVSSDSIFIFVTCKVDLQFNFLILSVVGIHDRLPLKGKANIFVILMPLSAMKRVFMVGFLREEAGAECD